ncbi:MAG: hypothetical protein JOY82_11215 [Streptosporangiaceae bacterium]|nr:hypothetical protein [Streptosporangiaceae bacterium]MBV9855067.1 hypothetical protein [Streptosporangiaceae bacterium]
MAADAVWTAGGTRVALAVGGFLLPWCVLLARADRRASLAAVATGTLLAAGAWFDVCTASPGLGQVLALAEAVFAEVPLAAGAIWLAVTLTRGAS